MPVFVDSGPGLGDALLRGVQGFAQGRQRKRADEMFQAELEDRLYRRNREQEGQDLSLALQGMHRGQAPLEAMNLGGGGLGPNGTITAPTVAPSRYTQLTPGVYRDENEVAQNRRTAAAAAFEKSFGEALAKSQGEAAGRPTEFTPLTTDGGVFNYDKRTGALGSRLGDRPTPQTTPSFQPVTTAGGVFAFDTKGGALGPRLGDRPPAQAPVDNTLVPVQRPDGSSVYTPRALAIGQPVPTPAGITQPTEGERKNAALLLSAEQGFNTLEGLIKGGKGIPSWKDRQLSRVGMGAGNMMTGDEYRQLRQSALQLSDAWLRFTSGAAVPESEVERTAATFIPEPGDDPTTLAQKAASRKTMLDALRLGAGRAMPKAAGGDTAGVTIQNPWRQP